MPAPEFWRKLSLINSCLVMGLFLGTATPLKADNWNATIYENGSPQHMVGVDKKKHTFNLFEKKSPLKLRYSYPCVTGQIPGDKQQINDLRTPEGIYFVEYKIANGLDFREYGGVAYTLNYPNPVDKLRGKTGHGIWIHSKGFELVPTKGCVAIGLKNIAEVGPMLVPGTAVVVAEELSEISAKDNGTPERLKALMQNWSETWASRSHKLFDFYDPAAYTKATENFTAFKQNKERLFKILSFIKIFNREIHALEGPGYWVTWAEQLYTASNLSTEGVRRLYWQKTDNDDFKIVGMEWIPRDIGMHAEFKKGLLVAEAPAQTVSDASEAPKLPRLDMPEMAPKTEDTPASKLVAVTEPLVPKRSIRTPQPDEIVWGQGRGITEPEKKNPRAPQLVLPARSPRNISGKKKAPGEQAVIPQESNGPEKISLPNIAPGKRQDISPTEKSSGNATVDQAADRKPKLAAEERKLDLPNLEEVGNKLLAWEKAFGNRSEEIYNLYDRQKFNLLPAKYGISRKHALNSVLKSIKQDFQQPWLYITSGNTRFATNGPIVKSETEQLVVTPAGHRQGIQNLWWKKDDTGEYKIVGAEFKPMALGLEADFLEHVSADISATIEAWRKAWESADLDKYLSYYDANASQQGRVGEKNIRKQKETLWTRVKPTQVNLSGMRLLLDRHGVRADMQQTYKDSAGKSDRGIKTIILKFDGNKWSILREDWSLAQQAVRKTD